MPAAKSRIWGAESVATLPNEMNRTDDGTWRSSQSMHGCFSWVVSLIMWSPVPSSQNCASGSNGPISKITLVCKNRFKVVSFKAIQHQLSFLEALLHPTMMAEFPFQTSWMVCYNPRSAILVGLQHERLDIEDHGLTDTSSTLCLTTPPLQKTPNPRALDSLWSQNVLGVLRLNTWIQHKQHFCSFLITRTEFIKLWKMLNPENNADKKALDFWMKNLPLSWSWLTARSTRPRIGERIYYREV